MCNLNLWFEVIDLCDKVIVLVSENELISEGYVEVEYCIVRLDGCVIWLFDWKYLIKDVGGEVSCVCGIVMDVIVFYIMFECM